MSNQKLVSIDDAKVATLAVEIKTVTIGRKQMTHSVFKQLPSDVPLIDDTDETLRLNGLPWGRVNYHWGNCDTFPHLHILWQRDSTLMQSVVRFSKGLRVAGAYIHDRDGYNRRKKNLIAAGILLMAGHTKTRVTIKRDNQVHGATATLQGWATRDVEVVQILEHAQMYGPVEDRSWKKIIDKGFEILTSERVPHTTTTKEIHALVQEAHDQTQTCQNSIDQYNRIYQQRIVELQTLEQLFIAA
jgi:hypothetical protein